MKAVIIFINIMLSGVLNATQTINTSLQNQTQEIPPRLYMHIPEELQAVADTPFRFSFKKYIHYFEENEKAGAPPIGTASPNENNGLHFDPSTYSIVGTPLKTGISTFKIGAYNQYSTAAPVNLFIHIGVNKAYQPKFKTNVEIPSGQMETPYQLDLNSLLDPSSIKEGDQIHFSLKPQINDSPYFKISESDNQILTGLIPDYEAGKTLQTTIIAHSNVGGESDPFSIKIPVPFDPQLKPQIKPIHLTTEVHFNFHEELAKFIIDPTQDGTLKLIIEKIEPEAPWLHIAPLSPTEIEGIVPDDAIGQLYTLYLRANTVRGGSSDLTKATLQVKTNPDLTPMFKMDKPVLPILQPGTPYEYCFVEHRDVYPEYEDYPYIVELYQDYENPFWVQIENNCLVVNNVPSDLEYYPSLLITVKNIPGGKSRPFYIDLPISGLLSRNTQEDPKH